MVRSGFCADFCRGCCSGDDFGFQPICRPGAQPSAS